jgi:lauroyl/myristoyl acyltransferase
MEATVPSRPRAARWLRRAVPPRLAPRLAHWWIGRRWTDRTFREKAEAEMRFLLEHTDRAAEVPALARGWAEQMQLRSVLRWHPRAITRQEVRGIEWLTTKRDPTRGVVLNFMHHHRYEGMFASLRRQGVQLSIVAHPAIVQAAPGTPERQHARVVAMGGEMIESGSGTAELAERLEHREIVAIATDFPGRTEMTFLGRRVLGGFGAARLAAMTNSPVVLVTVERDAGRPYLQVHQGLEPSDFDGPAELLEEILRRHEPAVLAWPEATDGPTLRFAVPDDAEPTTPS